MKSVSFLFLLVSIRCGGSSTENNTYFQSTGTETGACNVNICPLEGVCQLRLDFSKFDISQPSTEASLTLAVKSLNGAINRKFKTPYDKHITKCLF